MNHEEARIIGVLEVKFQTTTGNVNDAGKAPVGEQMNTVSRSSNLLDCHE